MPIHTTYSQNIPRGGDKGQRLLLKTSGLADDVHWESIATWPSNDPNLHQTPGTSRFWAGVLSRNSPHLRMRFWKPLKAPPSAITR